MYFTNTPSLNSIEAMMKRPPGSRQRGGGRNRSPYRYRKKDCDCRLCLYYRKRNGCVMKVCPVLDIRLSCKAASFREAVKAAFADVKHIPFQRRLSQIYDRKDDVPMLFQNDRHRQIFETQQISLRKPDSGAVEKVLDKQASGRIWAVLRGDLPCGKRFQIGWHSPTIWLQDKGTGLQSTLAPVHSSPQCGLHRSFPTVAISEWFWVVNLPGFQFRGCRA